MALAVAASGVRVDGLHPHQGVIGQRIEGGGGWPDGGRVGEHGVVVFIKIHHVFCEGQTPQEDLCAVYSLKEQH